MIEKPLFRQLFIFSARPTVIAIRVNTDSAARSEDTGYFDVFGVHQADKVFHDDIDTIMEAPWLRKLNRYNFSSCFPTILYQEYNRCR